MTPGIKAAVDDVAIYDTELTLAQEDQLYRISSPIIPVPFTWFGFDGESPDDATVLGYNTGLLRVATDVRPGVTRTADRLAVPTGLHIFPIQVTSKPACSRGFQLAVQAALSASGFGGVICLPVKFWVHLWGGARVLVVTVTRNAYYPDSSERRGNTNTPRFRGARQSRSQGCTVAVSQHGDALTCTCFNHKDTITYHGVVCPEAYTWYSGHVPFNTPRWWCVAGASAT